jgi:hypothetical protein
MLHALPRSLALLLRREPLALAGSAKRTACRFRRATSQVAGCVTKEPAVFRIGRAPGDAGQLERLAVVPGRVTAAMVDDDRVRRRRFVEIAPIGGVRSVNFVSSTTGLNKSGGVDAAFF